MAEDPNKIDKQLQEDMMFDTSTMTAEQAQAMEVAEAAREKDWREPSFAGQLFMGTFRRDMLDSLELQDEADKAIGDELCAKVEKYLVENLDPEEVDATRELPKEYIKGLADLGLFGMKVPKEYEGLGLSQVNYNRIATLVASYDGATATLLSAHQSIGVPNPLKMFGTPEQKKKYFPQLAKGAISAFALTEPGVGSDPAQMATMATPTDDGHFLINGDKLWCTNGTIADLIVVMAQTPPKMVRGKEKKQISAFIVEARDKDGNLNPGIEIVHRCDFMGLRGIYNGLLRFKDLKVPAENILWGEGRGLALALRTLNTGRLTLPAASSGLAKMCLKMCRDWGEERVQWGKPIAEHEAGAQKVAYIASMALAFEAITAVTSLWTDKGGFDMRIEAAMSKLFCTEKAWQVIDTTMQFRGGRGYERADSLRARGEKAYPVERAMRDCRINMILEGSTEIMHLFLAREAMDPHFQKAGDILNPRTSFGQKFAAFLNCAAFYPFWMTKRYINGSYLAVHSEYGQLGTHMSFVEVKAHELARKLFRTMAIYGPALEKKQMLLSRFVEVGTELFAISCTCAYAQKQYEKTKDKGVLELADHFSVLARRRVQEQLRAIRNNDDDESNALSEKVMKGKYTFMEEGIIWTHDS